MYFLYFIRFSRGGQMFRPRDKSYSQWLCSHSYEKSKAMFFTLHFSPSLLTPMPAAAACAFSTICASLLPTDKLIGDHRLGAGLKLPVQSNLVYVLFVITSWISTSHRDSSFNQRMLKWSKCLTTTSLLISVSVSILSIKNARCSYESLLTLGTTKFMGSSLLK